MSQLSTLASDDDAGYDSAPPEVFWAINSVQCLRDGSHRCRTLAWSRERELAYEALEQYAVHRWRELARQGHKPMPKPADPDHPLANLVSTQEVMAKATPGYYLATDFQDSGGGGGLMSDMEYTISIVLLPRIGNPVVVWRFETNEANVYVGEFVRTKTAADKAFDSMDDKADDILRLPAARESKEGAAEEEEPGTTSRLEYNADDVFG